GYGTPVVFDQDGEKRIAWMSNESLSLVRAENGEILDQVPWTSDYATTACTPIVIDGAIFVSSGYNKGCALYDVKDGKLEERYANRNMRNHMASCVLWDGHLIGP